jgi:hypothetical protein
VFDILDHERELQRNNYLGDVAAAGSRLQLFSDVSPSPRFAALLWHITDQRPASASVRSLSPRSGMMIG